MRDFMFLSSNFTTPLAARRHGILPVPKAAAVQAVSMSTPSHLIDVLAVLLVESLAAVLLAVLVIISIILSILTS